MIFYQSGRVLRSYCHRDYCQERFLLVFASPCALCMHYDALKKGINGVNRLKPLTILKICLIPHWLWGCVSEWQDHTGPLRAHDSLCKWGQNQLLPPSMEWDSPPVPKYHAAQSWKTPSGIWTHMAGLSFASWLEPTISCFSDFRWNCASSAKKWINCTAFGYHRSFGLPTVLPLFGACFEHPKVMDFTSF